ncbi:MAG: (d)CMP kinase [Clostridiales Family XIII bacterium]|nr:(d)CMP kinase [Clostridiales Family XIII bacterium]
MKYIVAVDGPSGAGKSTVSKLVAEKLGIAYLDTGAMYRALALKIVNEKTDLPAPFEKGEKAGKLEALLADTEIEERDGRIFLDGRDVSGYIRMPEVAMIASASSALPEVRAKLVAIQRKHGERWSVIADGRDIGSNVFPGAKYKFYLTASPEERARRRRLELKEKGLDIPFEKVLSDINERDYADANRKVNPLTVAEGAEMLVTDGISAEQAADFIAEKVRAGETGS